MVLQIGKNYTMKNGNEVHLLRIYQDFFSEEEFVVIKQAEQVFISRRFEFEAHIVLCKQKMVLTHIWWNRVIQ